MKRHCPSAGYRVSLSLGMAMAFSGICGPSAVAQKAAPPSLPLSPDRPADMTSLPAQTSSSPFHIAGVVIDAITRSPVPNVVLTAVPMTTVKKDRRSRRRFQNASDSATTDSEGRFDLTVAAAGGWELSATARNYGTQQLDEHNGYSSAVVLTESAPRFNLEFRMTPGSVIQGFVLDEAGEAVRGANVALVYLPPPAPDNQHRLPQSRAQQMTDDRGFYKFALIARGSYEVRVSAHPWYATAASSFGFSAPIDAATANTGPDPLDVVYPTLWYPGATDPTAATPIILRGGETQEANFRLLPVPGSHLHIAGTVDPSNGERNNRPAPPNTFLSRILPDGSEDPQMNSTRMDNKGNADIAGLSAGTYLVHQQLPGSNSVSLSTIQIGAGSPRTLDLSEAIPATTVTVKVDPAADQDSLQVSFRDTETGNTLYAQHFQGSGRPSLRHRGQITNQASENPSSQTPIATPPDRTVNLPPGKYEVFLSGISDLHLASIEATGATATGRTVLIGSGSPTLLLHTAAGLGTVTGVVNLQGKPDSGAMVLLVPATLDSPSGIDLPSRDQSNTDGSFEMTGLLPGGYILVAIDHGWDVNWADPATLRRFLVHGIPLDIKPGSDIRQTIEAQLP